MKIQQMLSGMLARAALAVALCIATAGPALAAATYTWNAASGAWGTAANWTPARTVPAADDILVFDGTVQPAPSVTGVPAETIGQIHVIHGAIVTIASGIGTTGTGTITRASGSATVVGTGTLFLTEIKPGDTMYGNTTGQTHEVTAIANNTSMTVTPTNGAETTPQTFTISPRVTVSGGPGVDFEIAAGCSLRVETTAPPLPPINLYLATGATGEIAGGLTFVGNIHRLHAADANAIQVLGTGIVRMGLGLVGSAFTQTGPSIVNTVIFQSGSTYLQQGGANPFGLTAPASKVVFQPGSNYRFMLAGLPSLSNRTYANFFWEIAGAPTVTAGTLTCTMQNLTMVQDAFNITAPLPLKLLGDLTVPFGTSFNYSPSAPATLSFEGPSIQTFKPFGFVTLGPNADVLLNNAAGLQLSGDLVTQRNVTLTAGNVITGLFGKLVIGPAGNLIAGSNWVDGFLQKDVPAGGPVSRSFEVGRTLTLDFASVGTSGPVVVKNFGGDHAALPGSGLSTARSANTYWQVTRPFGSIPAFTSCDVTMNILPTDLDSPLGGSTATLAVGKYDAPSWSFPAVGTRTPTSVRATGLTSFSDLQLAEPCTPFTFAPPTLPAGSPSVPYSQTVTVSGGTGPLYNFTVIAGALPPGLSLSLGGLISGTPTAGGSYSFTVKAQDSGACTGTQAYTIVVADYVSAQPVAGTCISTATPCVSVPVVWTRTDATPARATSITIELSPNLSLCGVQLASGGYFTPPTTFLVTPDGANRWIVDESTLGLPCGVTGTGTLFNVFVSSGDATGSGTIAVTATTARDCSNGPIPAVPGPVATVNIDHVGPSPVADMAAAQVKTGNAPPHATTKILLTWTAPGDAVSAEVWRKEYGGYPQYDENGGAPPSAPASPAAAALAGWTLTPVTASGQTDEPSARDFWYYVVYTKDACGNTSAVSNRTGGTLDYHLGDVSNGTPCVGDDAVSALDISYLGANYFTAVPVNGAAECLDVGPTTDYSTDARPTTDNFINFEDLMVFALNFLNVSAPQTAARPAVRDGTPADALVIDAPAEVRADETFTVRVVLHGTGRLQGLSARLGWDATVAEPAGMTPGTLFGSRGMVLAAGPGGVDAALLGVRDGGLTADGVVATFEFRALKAGAPAVRLLSAEARDAGNRALPLQQELAGNGAVAWRTGLAPARPMPFRNSTQIEYSLGAAGRVQLAIYGVDGRLVRTLVRGSQAPGEYRLTWDGRNDHGETVAAGMFYARLSTDQGRFTRTLVRLGR